MNNRKNTDNKEKKKVSFLDKIPFFKSSEDEDSQFLSYFKTSNSKKSCMEKEWSKACGQMDKRAQLLQVNTVKLALMLPLKQF